MNGNGRNQGVIDVLNQLSGLDYSVALDGLAQSV